jgi:hypothetical protein
MKVLFLAALCCVPQLHAQATATVTAGDPIVVSTDHPRLFLRPARLRLLKRERERTSPRWVQFETLMAGNAPMPEPGFALALYYRISGDAAAGQKAAAWALGPGADLRQLALVYDWCQDALSPAQRRDLAARIEKRMAQTAGDDSIAAVRSRVLAAVTLFDDVPQTPQRELERVVRDWWNGKMVPALKNGHDVVSRDDAYPMYELFHAMQDNVFMDLRESSARFFKELPIEHLLSYYPAIYQAPENDYYIGAERAIGEPDVHAAAFSRAADLAMAALDTNSPETQFLQGWLMHDRFMLRGTLGAPYEFLWANPYQPGLSYYHVPMVFYTPEFGHLFVRSSWEDTAEWFGHFDGVTQLFRDGGLSLVNSPGPTAPISMTEATICYGATSRKFQLALDEGQPVFIIGLEPRRTYRIEVDDEEMFEATADPGGVLELDDVPHGKPIGVRMQ